MQESIWELIFIALWLGVLAGIDLRYKKIPYWLLAASGIIATCVSVYLICTVGIQNIQLLWSALPGVGMLLISLVSKKAGWADGIVLVLLGVMAGFRVCVFSFALSMLIISMVSLVLLMLKRVGKNTKIPYLPFLWIGYLAQTALGLGA